VTIVEGHNHCTHLPINLILQPAITCEQDPEILEVLHLEKQPPTPIHLFQLRTVALDVEVLFLILTTLELVLKWFARTSLRQTQSPSLWLFPRSSLLRLQLQLSLPHLSIANPTG